VGEASFLVVPKHLVMLPSAHIKVLGYVFFCLFFILIILTMFNSFLSFVHNFFHHDKQVKREHIIDNEDDDEMIETEGDLTT